MMLTILLKLAKYGTKLHLPSLIINHPMDPNIYIIYITLLYHSAGCLKYVRIKDIYVGTANVDGEK